MDGHIERLTSGRVRASLFAAVADGAVLTVSSSGRIYAQREPQPQELYRSTYAQLEAVRTRVAAGKLTLIERMTDLERARSGGRPTAILAAEGGDFLEGRLDRVQEAYDRGIRSIQLVHYRVNELGDGWSRAAGALDLFGRVAERAEDPVVQPGSAGLHEEVRVDVLPHDVAVRRDLEDPPVASLADERVAVREPLRA
jgi:microsomal dipeptidase-like Zn-dependent dipeptidase